MVKKQPVSVCSGTSNRGVEIQAHPSPVATWPGGVLYKSSDNVDFESITGSTFRMFYGTCTTTLGDPPSLWTWDMVNSLTIQMTNGTLAGTTDINVLNGANCLIVGNEVIQYANAVESPPGTFTISRLLRGRQNTEYAAYGHGASEKAIDPTTGLQRLAAPLAVIGLDRWYKAPTVGQDPTATTSQDFPIAAHDLMPACPVALTGVRDGGNNLTIGWTRRTRYGGPWLNNTGNVPLNEAAELYSIDVYSGITVVRTITWTPGTYDGNGNPTAAYSATDQTGDGLTPGNLVHVKIYQMSDTVGRGFPADATI